MNALHNARLERALIRREVEIPSVDGRYGIVCNLVPRCEGIVARFTIRDMSTVPSEVWGERNESWTRAVHNLERCYDIGPFTATTALAEAETEAWHRLHEMGYDVPEEFRS